MGRVLEIRNHLTVEQLRALARRDRSNRALRRLLAFANALDGMSRADPATAAGMARQALRDAVPRNNAERPEGVRDHPLPGRPPTLNEAEPAPLSDRICRGPDPESDGASAWTLPDLCRWIEARFHRRLTPQSLSRILQREDFSQRKTRSVPPKTDEAAQRRFEKGSFAQP